MHYQDISLEFCVRLGTLCCSASEHLFPFSLCVHPLYLLLGIHLGAFTIKEIDINKIESLLLSFMGYNNGANRDCYQQSQ